MASILDFLGGMSPEQNQGLLAAAAQVLRNSGPSRQPYTLGMGLGDAIGAYQGNMEYQKQRKLAEQEAQQVAELRGYAIRDRKSDYEAQEAQRTRAKNLLELNAAYQKMRNRPQSAPPVDRSANAVMHGLMGGGMPQMDAPGAPMQPPAAAAPVTGGELDRSALAQQRLAYAQYLRDNDFGAEAQAEEDAALKMMPEFDTTPRTGQGTDGKPFQYLVGKRGEKKILDGVLPREELKLMNLGGKEQAYNPFELKPGQTFQRTMTPGEIAADRRAAQSNALRAQEIAMGGKPPPGYRWVDGGTLAAIPGGPGDKLPESQQKQLVGVNNVKAAIAEYRASLKSFGGIDALNPDARAVMGTKYNNMMLQAKEAYNLGVLNGPDFDILQSVITDPRSAKGAFVSKKALDTQASELDRLMTGIGEVSSQVRQPQQSGGGRQPPSAPTAKVATLADIAATARASGRSTAEVTAALRAKGWTIGGQ